MYSWHIRATPNTQPTELPGQAGLELPYPAAAAQHYGASKVAQDLSILLNLSRCKPTYSVL